jgi:hypothetical protein
MLIEFGVYYNLFGPEQDTFESVRATMK